mmetsp:Transcript_111266/g.346848  ORF Transcript_111266/g.346848 Transcript_111266/m.346848 type:complete len:316 (-) Transcript_111266:120-1067(-)
MLSLWRNHQLVWREVIIPQPAAGSGVAAVPVGRDRLLLCPATPTETIPTGSGLRLTQADEFWLVGANECTAAHDPRARPEPPFAGLRRAPLPLAPPTRLRFTSFDGSALTVIIDDDSEDSGEVLMRKFRLMDAGAEDLRRVHFAEVAEPLRVQYHPRQGWIALRNLLDRHGLRGYGGLLSDFQVAPMEGGDVEHPDGFVVQDAHSGEELGCVFAEHHRNHSWMGGAIDSELLLACGDDDNEDAFYSEMRLLDWRTGQQVKSIPLGLGPRRIECEWDRGPLLGLSQTFFTAYPNVEGADADTSVVAFCSPVPQAAG